MNIEKVTDMIVFFVFVFFVFVPKVSAYLDPGTGSYMIQLVTGGLLGSLFLIKNYWRDIVSTIKKIFSKKNHENKENKNK